MTDPESSLKRVTLDLPSDLLTTIASLSRQTGQPQSQVLLDALRRGLTPEPSVNLVQLANRLAALETLPPRLEALEGKSIAS